jgi:hypothetical protein
MMRSAPFYEPQLQYIGTVDMCDRLETDQQPENGTNMMRNSDLREG